uniref:Uncharacterized protein n=1 Tax=Arundo donax TaxID=35708 RepID=A0A0A9TU29_ARUDO
MVTIVLLETLFMSKMQLVLCLDGVFSKQLLHAQFIHLTFISTS